MTNTTIARLVEREALRHRVMQRVTREHRPVRR
jgi:hypothetical protein